MPPTTKMALPEYFWGRVDRAGECWLWTGSKTSRGYGDFRYRRRHYLAHRFAYTIVYGPIPVKLSVCHRCDVRLCCRPDHLFAATQKENLADMSAKGRGNHSRRSFGAAHYKTKFTEADVLEMHARYVSGERIAAIARHYRIDRSTIWGIIRGKTWRHVKPPSV